MSDLEAQGPIANKLGRRTIVKGAAWSVPVIAAAVAAPAASASVVTNTDLGIAFTGASIDLKQELLAGLDTWRDSQSVSVLNRVAFDAAYLLLRNGIRLGTAIANIGYDYPSDLVVSNIGTTVLDAGQFAALSLGYSDDLLNLNVINAENPSVELDVIAVGGGSAGIVTAGTDVAPGGTVASVPLRYNPITVEVNLLGADHPLTQFIGSLSGDSNDRGNSASTPVGLRLDVLGPLGGLVGTVLGLVGLNELKIPISVFS